MDKLLFEKCKNTFIVLSGCLAVCLILFILLIGNIIGNIKVQQKISLTEKQFYSLKSVCLDATDEAINAKKAVKSKLENSYYQLTEQLKAAAGKADKPLTTLAFKQQLFQTQEKLSAQAQRMKIVLPADIGFKDYEVSMPAEVLVPRLMRELFMTEKILGLLLDSRVQSIKTIEFSPRDASQTQGKTDSRELSFKTVALKLSFETDYANLKDFLNKLTAQKEIYIIPKMKNQKVPDKEKLLFVEMEIGTLMI